MSGRQTINTNIRLNLANEDDRRAWAYLQNLDRKKYKSYSRAVVTALNDYFDRQERLAVDPYLETREKEDAFLLRVQETIERSFGHRALSEGECAFCGKRPPMPPGIDGATGEATPVPSPVACENLPPAAFRSLRGTKDEGRETRDGGIKNWQFII